MAITIRLRRGTTAEWEAANPVLASAEPGVEFPLDGPPLWKIGDGTTAWNDLEYTSGGDSASLAALLASTEANDGAHTVAYHNPDGRFNNAATIGAVADDIHANGLRKGQGAAVPSVASINASDRILFETDDGFRGAPASAVLSVGQGQIVSADYSLQSADRRVVAMAVATITVPKQVDQAFDALTSIELLKTADVVVSIQGASGVQINGVSGASAAINSVYTIVRLVRNPVTPDVWYLSGDVTAVTDVEPPVFTAFSPVDNAVNVSTGSDLYADLNEVCAFGASGVIELWKNDGGWTLVESFDVATEVGSGAGQVELTNGGTRLVIHRTAAMTGGVGHAIEWSAGAIEDVPGGNPIAASDGTRTIWSFTTFAPAVTEVTPVIYTGDVVPAGTGTFDIPVPAGIQEGDWVDLIVASTSRSQIMPASLPAYWSVGVDFTDIATAYPSSYVIRNVAATLGDLPTHVTVDKVSGFKQAYAWVVLRGAAGELDKSTGTFGTSGLPDGGSLQQAAANCGRMLIGVVDNDDIDDIAPPSPYSLLWRQNCGQYDGSGVTIAVGWRTPQGAAGDTHNPGPFTGTGNDAWTCIHNTYASAV